MSSSPRKRPSSDVRQSLPRATSSAPAARAAIAPAEGLALAGGVIASPDRSEPWGPVLGLGDRAVKIGAAIGLCLALGTHGFASARAMLALYEMQKATDQMRTLIHEFFWSEYDVDPNPQEVKPEPQREPEPPPPEPEPEPIVQHAPKEAPKDDPYEPEPQKAAPVQAAKILTAPSDPNKIEDLTGNAIVSGDNTNGPLGGQSSAAGTSTIITKNPDVSNTGKPGGTGTADAPPPPAAPKPDLSRPAGIIGGSSWSNCPFPDEADTDQIDYAQVTLIVTVRPDGTPQSVQVTGDPGHGFGRAARMCALARKYNAGLDKEGKAATMSTPPIRVTFSR